MKNQTLSVELTITSSMPKPHTYIWFFLVFFFFKLKKGEQDTNILFYNFFFLEFQMITFVLDNSYHQIKTLIGFIGTSVPKTMVSPIIAPLGCKIYLFSPSL